MARLPSITAFTPRSGEISYRGVFGKLIAAGNHARPWQCLNFLPEPHGQGALRGVPAQGGRGPARRGPLRSAPFPELGRRGARGGIATGLLVVPVARASSAIASSGSPPAIAIIGAGSTRNSTWLNT
jgi:hypothetical protein